MCAPGGTTHSTNADATVSYVTVPGTSVHAMIMHPASTSTPASQFINAPEYIKNGNAMVVMQTDGNFVLYNRTPAKSGVGCHSPWSSGTYHKPNTNVDPGYYDSVQFDEDANLAIGEFGVIDYRDIYDCDSQPKAVCDHTKEIFAVQDDGNIVLYNTDVSPWRVTWSPNVCVTC